MLDLIDHIAITMDGNRRWSKANGCNITKGYEEGVKKLEEITFHAIGKVKHLTCFAFSVENWNRPKSEVSVLLKILNKVLDDLLDNNSSKKWQDKGVRFSFIGDLSLFDTTVIQKIEKIEEKYKENNKIHLVLAISYGSRQEIIGAIKKIVSNKIKENKINNDLLESYLLTKSIPTPDIVIRTGNEHRLSNFLLWQSAYSELFFISKMWPEFLCKDFDEVIKEFKLRNRRYGK